MGFTGFTWKKECLWNFTTGDVFIKRTKKHVRFRFLIKHLVIAVLFSDAGSSEDHSKHVDVANPSSTATVVALPPIASPAVSDMIEPDVTTRQKIYSQGGRSDYLRTRHRRRPESRYAFPVVSSWEYGWRLGDVIPTDAMHNPAHGRCRIISDTFYRSNGLPQLGWSNVGTRKACYLSSRVPHGMNDRKLINTAVCYCSDETWD